jgi:cysteine desulfuration protein SufE
MTSTQTGIPPRLNEIIEDFQLAEGREKIDLLIEYAEKMPPLPERLARRHNRMEQVEECMTPVYVLAETKNRRMRFYFDIPPQSPTVRGFAALLSEGLQDATPEQVLQVPGDFFMEMGLDRVLTSQRLNGISAILAHMKHLAVKEIS